MAAQPHRLMFQVALAAFFTGVIAGVPNLALADKAASASSDTTIWYIVGGPEGAPANYGDRLTAVSRPSRVDVGVTLSRLSPADVIAFTSGSTSPGAERAGGYAFLVSGAYDFDTGTLVTPRIVGGVGVSYLGAERRSSSGTGDPTADQDMAPTAQIGFGADFDLGDTWALSAEYRAMYLGETERPGSLGESRLDQKFTVGAKIRF